MEKGSTKRVSDALLGLQKESDNLDAGIEDATLKTIALLTTGGRLRATAQKAIETNQSHVQNMHGILTGLQLTVEQTGESFNNGLQSLAGELDNSASPLLQSYQLVEQQLKASQARTEEHLQKVTSYVKPSGYFYIRVPNVFHYPFHWSIDTKSHVNHFSPKKLTSLLEKNNMKKVDFIGVYDISTKVGKIYNSVFWKMKHFLPMYHQISFLCQKAS
jgi:hypothetical protein